MEVNETNIKKVKQQAVETINNAEKFIAVSIEEEGSQYSMACGFADKIQVALDLFRDAMNDEDVPSYLRLAVKDLFLDKINEQEEGGNLNGI